MSDTVNSAPTHEDLLGAAAEYGKAQSSLLQSRVELFKTEARLRLVRLVAALLAAATVFILLATAWVLLNIALAQWFSSLAALAGLGFTTAALLNLLLAGVVYAAMRHNFSLLGKPPAGGGVSS